MSYRDAVQMVQQLVRVTNANRHNTTAPSDSARCSVQSNLNSQTVYHTNSLTLIPRPQTLIDKVENREVEVQTDPTLNNKEEIPHATLLKVVQVVIGLIRLTNEIKSDINELVKATSEIDLNDSCHTTQS